MGQLINIYLAQRPASDGGSVEIYKEGKPTGEIIDIKGIRKLLDRKQFRAYLEGDSIFYVSADKYRRRKTKAEDKQLNGRSHIHFKFML